MAGTRVSWVKTKIQAFNDILDAAIPSVPVCGEDVEASGSVIFKYHILQYLTS